MVIRWTVGDICWNLGDLLGHLRHFWGPLGPYVQDTSDRGCAPVQILQDLQPLRHIWEKFRGQLMDFYKHLIDL